MSKTLLSWMQNGQYLPAVLRDFHDQKDVFKSVWQTVMRAKEKTPHHLGDMTWVTGHIFVIDHFLWFMAQHGYTLQRARKQPFTFYDLHETIKDRRDEEAAQLRTVMGWTCDPPPDNNAPPEPANAEGGASPDRAEAAEGDS